MAANTSDIQKMIFALQRDLDGNHIHAMLRSLEIPDSEWIKYAFINDSPRGYARNLIYECENFRFILICWKPGNGNSRHNHSNSDCYFKVLRGKIEETQWKENQLNRAGKIYEQGEVCQLEKLKATHCMKNCDDEHIAVTLHLYVPPFDTCEIYEDDHTGTNVALTFDSRFGYATEEGTTLLCL